MNKYTKVLFNSYYDSVTLMSLASKIKKETNANEVVVLMATEMNKDLINRVGLSTDEVNKCCENDCIIGVECEDDAENIVNNIIQKLNDGNKTKKEHSDITYKTQEELYKDHDSNMVVISVPGAYAAHEAHIALRNKKNVMLFSDNVSLEEELKLKTEAVSKDLLLMGPDCGTTIINGIGLCFANNVTRGNIGIIGASGTGLQEVTVLIDKLGYGISQAIGVGGRDLHKEIGALMTLQVLKALNNDEETKVIVVVSKPPEKSVEDKVIEEALKCKKPVVLCFIDGEHNGHKDNVEFCTQLPDAAKLAVSLIEKEADLSLIDDDNNSLSLAKEASIKLKPKQKYLRALYCGGTLCAETLSEAKKNSLMVKSNLAKKSEEKLLDPEYSEMNTIIDMGDDYFTNGKPHPMIEPTIRLDRIVKEAEDEETAVILLDFELGYGSHDDPVGVTVDSIIKAKEIAKNNNRELIFVAYVCGTNKDKQNYEHSVQTLKDLGVIVTKTNNQAAKLAISIIKEATYENK